MERFQKQGKRLKEFFESKGWTQSAAATILGVSNSFVSGAVNGQKDIPSSMIHSLEKHGCDIAYLLSGRKPQDESVHVSSDENIKRIIVSGDYELQSFSVLDGSLEFVLKEKKNKLSSHVFDEDELEPMDNVIVVQPSKRDLRKAAATPIISKE
ncbi:MAG TPA: helix-turn-helix transcriptional regulator [Candidatus Kapabacteria bacterium]|nr:helix-turn-helix transcriptional regulator [Candidatus Kapabacteria bacterium]